MKLWQLIKIGIQTLCVLNFHIKKMRNIKNYAIFMSIS